MEIAQERVILAVGRVVLVAPLVLDAATFKSLVDKELTKLEHPLGVIPDQACLPKKLACDIVRPVVPELYTDCITAMFVFIVD